MGVRVLNGLTYAQLGWYPIRCLPAAGFKMNTRSLDTLNASVMQNHTHLLHADCQVKYSNSHKG